MDLRTRPCARDYSFPTNDLSVDPLTMLTVAHLRKEFDRVVAVDDVSLTVNRGEIFGLLGPNGAGKTTTIRTVLNIIRPDAGTITFDGKHFTPEMWNLIG